MSLFDFKGEPVLNSLLRRLKRGLMPVAPRAMDDRPVFAIGDIHGCDDLLAALLESIAGIARGR